MNNSLAILEALLLRQPSTPAIDYVDGIVKTTSPLTVRCTGEDTDSPAEPVGRPMVANERVAVITIDKRRLAIPYGLASDPTLVPWTIPNRHVTIGPDGDNQPALELIRDRPMGRHSALMYVALGTTPELAWLLTDSGSALATLRVTKDGLRLQNYVTGVTRYFAYQDDLTAAVNRVAALETAQAAEPASAAGVAGPITLSGTTTTYNVAFPAGRFSSAPVVTGNLYSGTQSFRIDNVTATSCRVVIWSTSTMSGTAYVYWHAIAAH